MIGNAEYVGRARYVAIGVDPIGIDPAGHTKFLVIAFCTDDDSVVDRIGLAFRWQRGADQGFAIGEDLFGGQRIFFRIPAAGICVLRRQRGAAQEDNRAERQGNSRQAAAPSLSAQPTERFSAE